MPEQAPKIVSKPETREKLQVSVGSYSEKGENHPNNEDSLLVDQDNLTFGVFDGMGGHAAGEVASRIAKEAISLHINNLYKEGMSIEEVKDVVREAQERANSAILEDVTKNQERYGMGTTATIVKIHQDESGETWAIIGHAGDCRLYCLDKDNLRLVTTDNDYIGYINTDPQKAEYLRIKLDTAKVKEDLDSEEAQFLFSRRHVIDRSLGVPNFKPEVITYKIPKAAKLILTSDGVHDNLTREEIEAEIKKDLPAQQINENLVGKAVQTSKDLSNFRKKIDDISAITIIVE